MTRDERLKKYQEAGAEFVEAARSKAEELLHEVSGAGESTQGRASSTVDDLIGGGKRGTDQFFDAIRREISNQLKALGVATTADLEALEARLAGKKAPAAKAPAAKAPTPKAPATKVAASRVTASRVTPAKATAAPATKAPVTPVGKTARKAAPAARQTAATTTATPNKAASKAAGPARKTAKKATSSGTR